MLSAIDLRVFVTPTDMGSNGESSHTRRKRQITDEESSASDVERATTYTSSQLKKINRILKCHSKDYYGILNLPEDCSTKNIIGAYRKLAQFIHPDKNPFGGAVNAFKRINKAYEILADPQTRRYYDLRHSKHYKPDGEWDEGFHPKAFGDESGDEEEEEADPYPHLPQSIRNIYDEAAHAVNAYLSDPTQDKLDKIVRFNERIKGINIKDGRPSSLFLIQHSLFDTIVNDIRPVAEQLSSDPSNRKALARLHEIVANFEKAKMNHGYSSLWHLFIPPYIQERLERLGRQNLKNDKGKQQNKKSAPEYDSDTDMESQYSYQVSRSRWKPGETEKGEKILGYRPFNRTYIYDTMVSSERHLQGVRFIIEQKNKRNPIKLVSGTEVGRQCVKAYLSLQDSEKNDVRYSADKWDIKDLDNFDKIIGAAGMPFKNKAKASNKVYPDGYFLVQMKDGQTPIMSRAALRGILGKDDADRRIDEFYVWAKETPPWKIQPLNWRPQQLLIGPSEIDRDRRTPVLNYHAADFQLTQPTRTHSERLTRMIKDKSIDKYIENVIADRFAMLTPN